MAVTDIQFHVLDVGQGSCNYIEVFDGDDVLYNLLIDLGTNSNQAIAKDNLEWLRGRIVAHKQYLDVLIITHGDTDHYNMIAKILPAFGDPDNEQIGMVRYGGPDWRYGDGLIDTLKRYAKPVNPAKPLSKKNPADVAGFDPEQTSFSKVKKTYYWDPIWETDEGVKLQLIIANVPHPKDPDDMEVEQAFDAIAINTKSVIAALEWNGVWTIATGDATAAAMGAVNTLLTGVTESDLPDCFMLTMPHHGSRRTTYNLSNANNEPSPAAKNVVGNFLKRFHPSTVSISAGFKDHHHPSMLMTDQFADYTVSNPVYWEDPALGSDRHFITCWIDLEITDEDVDPAWPDDWLYATTQTEENIYSTLYFRSEPYNDGVRTAKKAKGAGSPKYHYQRYVCPPTPAEDCSGSSEQTGIPEGRNWWFTTLADGTLSVDSDENEARALATPPTLKRAPRTPPPSYATAAGRAARTTLAAPVATLRRIRPAAATRSIAEPAGPRLSGLKVIE
jgi:hypothetical protein